MAKTSVEDYNLDTGYQWPFHFLICFQCYSDVRIGKLAPKYTYRQFNVRHDIFLIVSTFYLRQPTQ